MKLYSCVTCFEEVNPHEGYNCPRCASGAASTQLVGELKPIAVKGHSDAPEMVIKQNARLLAAALNLGLHWYSADGPDKGYWAKVHQRLEKIASEGYPK